MGAGGKGGSTTSTVKIPAWLETAAQGNLARANEVSQIGYTPYYGPDVAALTPLQISGLQNTGQAASAFGLASPTDPMAGMPQSQTFAGGVQGYSSAPMFDQALAEFAQRNPGQAAAMADMFINPQTGALPTPVVAPTVPTQPVTGPRTQNQTAGGRGNGMAQNVGGMVAPVSGTGLGGYTGLGDMINGGGPGASGGTFQGGGLLSGVGNLVTRPAGSGGSSGMGGGK